MINSSLNRDDNELVSWFIKLALFELSATRGSASASRTNIFPDTDSVPEKVSLIPHLCIGGEYF